MDKESTKNQQQTTAHSTKSSHKTEAFGITDKELKAKDEVQRQLTITFDWLIANKVIVSLLLGVVLLAGLGYVMYSKVKLETELKVQEKYFLIEKKFLDQRTQFDEAAREQKAEQDKKKDEKNKATAKNKEDKELAKPKVLASGDLEKDYGVVVKEFNELIAAQPGALAGKMAALMLADIYADYNKNEDALNTLTKVTVTNARELIDLLVAKKKLNIMLSLQKYSEAEKELLKLISQNKYPFLNSHFKVLLGLSYEGLKQWDKAETLFQEVIAKGNEAEALSPDDMAKRNKFSSDVSASEQAQKYLILLRLRKDSEKAGS